LIVNHKNMSGISRIKNPINAALGLNEWGEREIIPSDFNSEIVETNQEFGVAGIDASKIKNLKVDTIEITPTGYVRSGKTTFTDTTNAGYILDANGFFMGNAGDTNSIKFTTSTGAMVVKGGEIVGSVIKTSSTNPDVQIDSTDGVTISGESLWFAVPAIAETTVDSYSESNYASGTEVDSSIRTKFGQTFACSSTVVLGSCKFYLYKMGSPTGNAVAKIYAHTGTFGIDGKPTGTELATSSNFNVSTLTGDVGLSTFTFPNGQNIILTSGVKYCVAIEYTGGDASNYIQVGKDNTSPTHSGNGFQWLVADGVWANLSLDVIFYVYSRSYGTEAGRMSASTTPSTGLRIANQSKTDSDSGYNITLDAGYQSLKLLGESIDIGGSSITITNGGSIVITPSTKLTVQSVINLKPRSTPSSGVEGDMYQNSSDHHLYIHNGTTWVQADN
jgi:hypothetical protein